MTETNAHHYLLSLTLLPSVPSALPSPLFSPHRRKISLLLFSFFPRPFWLFIVQKTLFSSFSSHSWTDQDFSPSSPDSTSISLKEIPLFQERKGSSIGEREQKEFPIDFDHDFQQMKLRPFRISRGKWELEVQSSC